jgi:hypothetical protein
LEFFSKFREEFFCKYREEREEKNTLTLKNCTRWSVAPISQKRKTGLPLQDNWQLIVGGER